MRRGRLCWKTWRGDDVNLGTYGEQEITPQEIRPPCAGPVVMAGALMLGSAFRTKASALRRRGRLCLRSMSRGMEQEAGVEERQRFGRPVFRLAFT
jgi:hypothetical protein